MTERGDDDADDVQHRQRNTEDGALYSGVGLGLYVRQRRTALDETTRDRRLGAVGVTVERAGDRRADTVGQADKRPPGRCLLHRVIAGAAQRLERLGFAGRRGCNETTAVADTVGVEALDAAVVAVVAGGRNGLELVTGAGTESGDVGSERVTHAEITGNNRIRT